MKRIFITGGTGEIRILGTPTGRPPQVYVPDTARIMSELGVRVTTSLADAIRRSAARAGTETSQP